MLGIVQGYAQLTVRFIGRIRVNVAVRNRRRRDRNKGQDRQNNQHSTNVKMLHSERYHEMIIRSPSIVKMLARLASKIMAYRSPMPGRHFATL